MALADDDGQWHLERVLDQVARSRAVYAADVAAVNLRTAMVFLSIWMAERQIDVIHRSAGGAVTGVTCAGTHISAAENLETLDLSDENVRWAHLTRVLQAIAPGDHDLRPIDVPSMLDLRTILDASAQAELAGVCARLRVSAGSSVIVARLTPGGRVTVDCTPHDDKRAGAARELISSAGLRIIGTRYPRVMLIVDDAGVRIENLPWTPDSG